MAEQTSGVHKAVKIERVVAQHLRADKSEFLTLEFIVSLGSIVVAVVCLDAAIKALFTLWNGATVELGVPFGWLLPVSGGYVGAVWAGFAAVVFVLLGMFFARRVNASLSARPAFRGRVAYKLALYVALTVLAAVLLGAVLTLFTVIITSLLLIGSESSIGSLYVKVFLPTLVMIAIAGYASYVTYRTAKGRGDLAGLYTLLLALSTVVLLGLIITVAVRSHDAYSANDYERADHSLINSNQSLPY